MSETPEEYVEDPFDPNNAPGLSLIMLMRIYDVMMTQLTLDHGETVSDNLLSLHARGAVLTPPPFFQQFLYDDVNRAELDEGLPDTDESTPPISDEHVI